MNYNIDLNEGQSLHQISDRIKEINSTKIDKVIISGLGDYINNIEPTDRLRIIHELLKVQNNLILTDFPYSPEQLVAFVSLYEMINLPVLDGSKNIFQYNPPQGFTSEERNRRAAQKRRQIAEFSEPNRRARERIVVLKAQHIKENEIARILKDDKIYSPTGKKLQQGSINRIYHGFMSLYKNFDQIDYVGAGVAEPAPVIKGKSKLKKSLDLKAMGTAPVKLFNKVMTLKFKDQGVPDHDFYLCFTGQEESLVSDTLYINKHHLVGLELSIDIREQTILSPGRYQVLLCTNPDDIVGSVFDKFTCDLCREFIEIKDIRFVTNELGKVLPFYTPQLEEAH